MKGFVDFAAVFRETNNKTEIFIQRHQIINQDDFVKFKYVLNIYIKLHYYNV